MGRVSIALLLIFLLFFVGCASSVMVKEAKEEYVPIKKPEIEEKIVPEVKPESRVEGEIPPVIEKTEEETVEVIVEEGVEETIEEFIEPEEERVEEEKPAELNYEGIELKVANIQQLVEQEGTYNSYNPKISFDERYIAIEVNLEMINMIQIYRLIVQNSNEGPEFTFEKVREVYLDAIMERERIEDFFESYFQETFNYEFSWFPEGSSFIFTSNAGLGEYNIFVGSVDEWDPIFSDIKERLNLKMFSEYLMMTEEVKKDGQAKVSPDGRRIVFTSGRTGNGDLYLLDLLTGELRRLTYSEDTDLFPQWSPDGRDIVYTTGGKQSHDIHVIRNVGESDEQEEELVKWFFDDVLPKYSPDGKMISFYTTYNIERDPYNNKRWGIMIIPSDGSAARAGKDLLNYFHVPDVIKDNYQGTAWFPDSKHIIYAKSIDSDYNPIYIYDVESREERFVETKTNINHDITVSPHGIVSFRAQVSGWDRIIIASTTFFQEYLKTLENLQ